MADLYGINYKKVYVDVPSEKYAGGDYAAQVRAFTETFELNGSIAQNDVIHLFKLTKGCRVVGGFFKSDDMGANGAFKLGFVSGDDALIAAVDASNGASTLVFADIDGAAKGDVLNAEQEVILTCTEATAATSGKIQVTLLVTEA